MLRQENAQLWQTVIQNKNSTIEHLQDTVMELERRMRQLTWDLQQKEKDVHRKDLRIQDLQQTLDVVQHVSDQTGASSSLMRDQTSQHLQRVQELEARCQELEDREDRANALNVALHDAHKYWKGQAEGYEKQQSHGREAGPECRHCVRGAMASGATQALQHKLEAVEMELQERSEECLQLRDSKAVLQELLDQRSRYFEKWGHALPEAWSAESLQALGFRLHQLATARGVDDVDAWNTQPVELLEMVMDNSVDVQSEVSERVRGIAAALGIETRGLPRVMTRTQLLNLCTELLHCVQGRPVKQRLQSATQSQVRLSPSRSSSRSRSCTPTSALFEEVTEGYRAGMHGKWGKRHDAHLKCATRSRTQSSTSSVASSGSPASREGSVRSIRAIPPSIPQGRGEYQVFKCYKSSDATYAT